MQNSQLPAKWFKPFAADDSAKVEIPLTTADPTRASQSLGFPPLTMQPPESGGVPPQGEDFNGAMNQVARFVWWMLGGGALPFDNAWATNAAIGGYPAGATISTADLQGEWISTADNNTNNPDTSGASWVPGFAYGSTAVAVTTADVTLTPAQAIKPVLVVSGAMTAARQLIVPAWIKVWTIVNNTTGGFPLTIKTAAGAGVVAWQGTPQTVVCDGVNCSSPRAPGTLLNVQIFQSNGTYTPTAGTTSVIVEGVGGGAAGCGAPATGASSGVVGGGGGGGAYFKVLIRTGFSGTAVTIGTAGAGNNGAAGGVGGTTSFGGFASAPGGSNIAPATPQPPPNISGGAGTSAVATAAPGAGGAAVLLLRGEPGGYGVFAANGNGISGAGGRSMFGPGAQSSVSGGGNTAQSFGAGGSGGLNNFSSGANAGGAGGSGMVIVWEYA